MNIIDIIKGKDTKPNPDYNPKTKKGALEPPYLVNTDYNKRDDFANNILENVIPNQYGLTLLGDPTKYSDYDITVSPVDSQEELDKQRAKNQSLFEQGTRAVGQTINEITLGTAVGTLDLVSIVVDALSNDGLKYERPELIEELANFKESINEAIPIYRQNPNAAFDVTDTGWWFNNMPTIVSSLTLMVPGFVGSKLFSAAGKTLGKVPVVSKTLNKTANILKVSQKGKEVIEKGVESASAGLIMRTLENYQEAIQVKQDAKDYAAEQLASMDEKKRDEFYKNNPKYVGKTDEEIAEDIATESASTTFSENWFNAIFDIYQVYGLKNMWTKALQGTNTVNLRNINRQAAAQFGDDAAAIQEKIAARTFGDKAVDYIKNIGYGIKEGTKTEWSEGIEEANNYIAQQDGMQVARYAFDKNTPKQTLNDYLKDPMLWESAFWGVLAGVVFSGASDAAVGYAQRKLNKDFINAEKQKENEIYRRSIRFQQYQDKINKIASGINPYIVNKNNTGTEENVAITTEEERELLKRIAKEEYQDDMIIDAIDNGNLDLLEAYIKDSNIAKGFREKLGLNETDAIELQTDFINRIDTIKNKYSNVFKLVNDAGGNYQIGSLIAKNIIAQERSNQLNELLRNYNDIVLNNVLNTPGVNITEEEKTAIRNVNYHNRLANIEKQIQLIKADASLNKKERELKLIEFENKKKELEAIEPLDYKDTDGNYNYGKDLLIAKKVQSNYIDAFNALWSKYDFDINQQLNKDTIDTSKSSIKKQVKRYQEIFTESRDKAINNAFNKRDELYEKYGDKLGTDEMSDEDRKTYEEISDILNVAEVSEEEILKHEVAIDKTKEIIAKYEETKSEEDTEKTPTDEELTKAAELAEETKVEPSIVGIPSTGEENKSGVGEVDTTSIINNETTSPFDDKSKPSTTETVVNTPTVNVPENLDTKLSDDIVERNNQIDDIINDKLSVLNSEQLTNVDYIKSYKQTVVDHLISMGATNEEASMAYDNATNALLGNFDYIDDIGNVFSTLTDDDKNMVINASLAIIRRKKKNGDKNIEAVIELFANNIDENGKTRGIISNNKVYFSVEKLIDYLYSKTNEDVIVNYLFETIKTYMNSKDNTKYVFMDDKTLLNLNRTEFSNRILQNIDIRKNLIREEKPNNINLDFTNENVLIDTDRFNNIIKLKKGEKLNYTFDAKVNRILLYDMSGTYIGYLGVPYYDMTTGKYKANNKGWNYDIAIDSKGNVDSNIKDFFKFILNSDLNNDIITYIFDNTDEEFEYELFNKLNDKGLNKYNLIQPLSEDADKNANEIHEIMQHLKKVFARAIRDGNTDTSIDNWFNALAYSYAQVSRVVEDNAYGEFVIDSINKGNLILSDKPENDITEVLSDYSSDKYPLFTIVADNTIQFANDTKPLYINNFSQKGVTMLAIPKEDSGFDSAQVQQVFLSEANVDLLNAAKTELYYGILNYLDGNYSDEDIAKIVNSLISANLTGIINTDYKVVVSYNAIEKRQTIGIKHKKTGKYLFNISGSGTKYSANVNIPNATGYTLYDKKAYFANKDKFKNDVVNIINELFNNATIAIPFDLINDKVKTIDKHSIYYKRENDKTIIQIGNYRTEHDSYQDFLVENKLIKTKLRNANDTDGVASGIYKATDNTSVNIIFKEIDNTTVATLSDNVNDNKLLKEINNSTAYDALKTIFKNNDKILDYIEFIHNFGLLPDNLIMTDGIKDTESNPIYGQYDGENIYLNKNRLANMNYKNFIRTIVHESLHYQLDKNYNKKEAIDKIEVIYNKFVKYLEDNKDRLSNEKFDDDTSVYDNLIRFTNIREDRDINLEEFLVESLTNSNLMTALNNIKSGKRETRMTRAKTLLQELLELVADLFGIKINKDSLLYEELAIVRTIKRVDEIANKKRSKKTSKTTTIDNAVTIIANEETKTTDTTEMPPVEVDTTVAADEATIASTTITPELTDNTEDYIIDDNINNEIDIDEDYDDNMVFSTINDVEFTNNQVTLIQNISPDLQTKLATLLADGTISMYCE